MKEITNDTEFRHTLEGMDHARQRLLAARFIQNVLSLADDERLNWVAKTAADPDASATELTTALHNAKAVTLDSYTRCGAECDWRDQARYFVARAAVAAVSPEGQMAGGPAWQAAMSSRMAQTCNAIDAAEDTAGQEQLTQYRILADFLTQ
jgi:hypothetical protein